uniref:RRM domain-containing protein n=1 Tax=Panagrolaimus superbus TaxID=310955 RepID=A0A914Y1E9_9BILA
MSYRNSRRERSRESSPVYNNYRERPRDDYRSSDSRHRNDYVDVPRSRHSIQINGLPPHIKSYEVEDFLGKKVGGPLKTIYFKPDVKNNEAVVAIRFDDLTKAKTCVETLHKTLMLGSKVFISYFQDFSRHTDFIEKKQQQKDVYRSPRGRSRDRSPIRSRSRPRFDHPEDNFYARTPPDYRANDRSKYFDDETEISTPQSSMPRRAALLPAPQSNPIESGVIPSIDIHSKFSSQRPPAPAPYPINGNLHSNNRLSIIPPPGFSSVLPISRDHLISSKFSASTFPDTVASTEPKMNDQTWRTPDPDTFSAARLNTVQTLKYQPQEKKNDIQGHFRLGSVSVEASKNEMRKAKFISLTPQARSKVEEKKQELLKAYQDDCGTYGFLCQSLINKNANLEESLRIALAEVLKDLEEGYKKTLDDFIELFLTD